MRIDIMPVATEKQIMEVAEEAQKVWSSEYREYYTEEQIEHILRKYRSPEALRQQLSSGYVHYMLLKNGELAGLMCVLPQQHYMQLNYLYVKEPFRRQGLAKKAVSHLEEVLRRPEHGFSHIKKIRVKVKKDNHFAIDICRHLGFAVTGEDQTQISEDVLCENVIMDRKIR